MYENIERVLSDIESDVASNVYMYAQNKLNVQLPKLFYFVVSAAQNGEFAQFGGELPEATCHN